MSKFIVETSARHIHVSEADLAVLFGEGAKLTNKKDLSQPGQFACAEKVTVVGPKKEIPGVTILGPVRPNTQIELSATDARSIGIKAPVKESGDIAGTPGCKIIGPCGEVEIKEGVIVAKRHIHLTPADAEALNVTDKEIVAVKIDSPDRSAILCDVVCRVHPNFALAMHIDTDEANAVGAVCDQMGEIIKL